MARNTRFTKADISRLIAESRQERAQLAALRAALIEGEQSGASTPFDFEAFIARKRASSARSQEDRSGE